MFMERKREKNYMNSSCVYIVRDLAFFYMKMGVYLFEYSSL